MDRFLLAENPMNGDGEALAIIHTIDPVAIIEVLFATSSKKKYQKTFVYINSDGDNEHWTLIVHHLFSTDMNGLGDEVAAEMINKLLNRAWHWYKTYLEWEDKNIDDDDKIQLN